MHHLGPSVRFLTTLLLLAPAPALAAPVELLFGGTIDEAIPGDSDGSVVVGTPFTVSVTFDDAAADQSPGDPSEGFYSFSTPPWVITLQVGSYTLSGASGFDIFVFSSAADPDEVVLEVTSGSVSGPLPGAVYDPEFQLNLIAAAPGSTLSSDALHPVPWDLASWAEARMEFGFPDLGPPSFSAGGPLESLVVVPEPGTAALLGMGIGLLGALRRAR